MWGSSAVSVDDDLSTGQSAIAIRAADNEAPGRVDVEFVFGAHPAIGQGLFHMRADYFPNLILVQIFGMLGGYDDRRRLYRLAALILQRYLAFRIRAEAGIHTGMAGLGQRPQNFMRIENRSWHENRGFGARIPEHDALIAGTLIFVADSIHALSDVDRLLMKMHFYFGVFQ